MGLGLDLSQLDFLIGVCAALSAFCAVVVVAWPYLEGDPLEARMRRLAGERDRIRRRERGQVPNPQDPVSLLRGPQRKLLSNIINWLHLDESIADGRIAQMLQTAGLRGRSAVITYVLARTIAPIVMFGAAFLYSFVVGLEGLSTQLLVAAAAGGLGYYLPGVYVKNRTQKRQQLIQRAWPDALDLMLICVESGMSIEPALQKVAQEIGPQSVDLAEELSLTTAELSYLPDRRQAYDNLTRRTGLESVKAVVTSLKQAEKQGTSLGKALRVMAQENRQTRLNMAEKKAAALPPKLTVPMILFFLPVLFVVIITPAVIQITAL